jgi:hypothetical protein
MRRTQGWPQDFNIFQQGTGGRGRRLPASRSLQDVNRCQQGAPKPDGRPIVADRTASFPPRLAGKGGGRISAASPDQGRRRGPP